MVLSHVAVDGAQLLSSVSSLFLSQFSRPFHLPEAFGAKGRMGEETRSGFPFSVTHFLRPVLVPPVWLLLQKGFVPLGIGLLLKLLSRIGLQSVGILSLDFILRKVSGGKTIEND